MGAQDIIGAMTGGLVQNDRLLKLDSPLGNNFCFRNGCRLFTDWPPLRIYGRSCFHFGTIELKTLIAQPVTLWIQQS